MSMYEMVHGRNPAAGILLAVLGFKSLGEVGRFRDAFVSNGEIVIYTRNGGGNRECWEGDGDGDGDCRCTGCIAQVHLPRHPMYLRDADDGFDCTYASFYFRVPDEAPDGLDLPDGWRDAVLSMESGPWDPDERWHQIISALEKS